jgi:hypothetical protein
VSAQTFIYAGAEQSYDVPVGAGSLAVLAVGAPGGAGDNGGTGAAGGFGATVHATLPVSAGEVLFVDVGARGPSAAGATGGTTPSYLFTGGNGGTVGGGSIDGGGAGGGASELRPCPQSAGLTCLFTPPLLVAAGGGGGGGGPNGGAGGAAGMSGGLGSASTAAGPGLLMQAMNGGTPGGGNGSLIVGGEGAPGSSGPFTTGGGGGGGGGYFGGGGGGTASGLSGGGGGGGGGSSFIEASATGPSITTDATGIPEIMLIPLPKVPSCVNNVLNTLPGGSTINVVLACTTPMGIAIKYAIAGGPSHGTLGAIDQSIGTVSYTPAPGFTGTDTFTFTAANSSGSASPATATITVPPASTTTPTTSGQTPAGHHCVVPRLKGSSLPAAKRKLTAAGCALGHITRPKTRKHHRPPTNLVVVGQGAAPGTQLSAGSAVSVTLGAARGSKPRHKQR